MADLTRSTYGFADSGQVKEAIEERLAGANPKLERTMVLLGNAIAALLEINSRIPDHHKSRYLVAEPLEQFARGEDVKTSS